MGQFIDISGQRFNRLIAIKRVENKGKITQWLFQCDCGNQKVINPAHVKNNMIKSCGCFQKETIAKMHFKDLTGQKIGRWTVLNRVENKGDFVRWECQCDCGKIKIVYANGLLNGETQSCGCYKRDKAHELNFDDLTGKRFGLLTVVKRMEQNYISPTGCQSPLWLCKCDCGKEKIVLSNTLHNNAIRSCGCKSGSCGEIYIKRILDDLNVDYIPQYRFKDCKNKLALPFDFYLPKFNICIEYDGQQHFEVVDFFNGEKGFAKRKHNDEIKNQYCQNNNIVLLRLPYYLSINEMKNKITNILYP